MDDNIDKRVAAQEALGMIGHMRPAKDHQAIRVELFDAPRRLQRDLGVPHIGAEPDDIGAFRDALQRLLPLHVI